VVVYFVVSRILVLENGKWKMKNWVIGRSGMRVRQSHI